MVDSDTMLPLVPYWEALEGHQFLVTPGPQPTLLAYVGPTETTRNDFWSNQKLHLQIRSNFWLFLQGVLRFAEANSGMQNQRNLEVALRLCGATKSITKSSAYGLANHSLGNAIYTYLGVSPIKLVSE